MTDQTVTVHKTNITNKASRPPIRPEPEDGTSGTRLPQTRMYHYDGIEWNGFDLGSRSHLPPPRLTSGIGRITMSVYRKHQLVVPLNHAEELQDWMERIADSPDILKEIANAQSLALANRLESHSDSLKHVLDLMASQGNDLTDDSVQQVA